MRSYEKQYMDILRNVYENGYADGTNERTGLSTKRLPCQTIRVDLEEEFPILTSKQVFWKSALDEILWIWQRQSNNIKDLKPHIWDEWADEKGSIGKAYGYQIAKPVVINVDTKGRSPEGIRYYQSQTDFVLKYLREFPNGRWANVTLWNPEELHEMHLCPCCFNATFNLDGGRLNCVLTQRSGDLPYGVPFNTTQYAMLTMLFARDLGVKPGVLLHTIADAHIYENQMEGVARQLAIYDYMNGGPVPSELADVTVEEAETFAAKAETALDCIPRFVVEGDTSFWAVAPENCRVEDYCHMGKISFGAVAV